MCPSDAVRAPVGQRAIKSAPVVGLTAPPAGRPGDVPGVSSGAAGYRVVRTGVDRPFHTQVVMRAS